MYVYLFYSYRSSWRYSHRDVVMFVKREKNKTIPTCLTPLYEQYTESESYTGSFVDIITVHSMRVVEELFTQEEHTHSIHNNNNT